MDLKFTKATDEEHEIKLEPVLIFADWQSNMAIGGQAVPFEIRTSMVGEGAPIKVVGKSANGKKLGKIKGVMKRNRFTDRFDIPDDIELGDEVYFEVKLPKNDLSDESHTIPAFPPVEVSNLKWSAAEARRGDVVTLSGDVKGLPAGAEVVVIIYEHDQDNCHDKITELPATVVDQKIELKWEYEYHEDTDEIPTDDEMQRYGGSYNPPEYFFAVKVGDTEYGDKQSPGLLTFKDWIEIKLVNQYGRPMPEEDYSLSLPDGTKRSGKLDKSGYAKEENIPPGQYEVEFSNL
ncbi:MAG: hypothetical protein ACE5FH_02465 [Candidatus Zixiibacteriota bacterium]